MERPSGGMFKVTVETSAVNEEEDGFTWTWQGFAENTTDALIKAEVDWSDRLRREEPDQ